MSARELITEHLDLWTGAVSKKSSSGRGSNGKIELTGVKKLRELILQLAVTGRLVEQNARDEPAATLVSKMLQLRDHLASTQGMRTKASDSVPSSDEYLSTPRSWAWVRLGNMAKFIDYRGKTPTKINTGKRLITAKNIRQGHIDLQPDEFISEADYTKWMTRGFPRKGDLLFTPEAPLGNAAIVDLDEEFALAQRAICFQWHIPETSQFMLIQILASPFQEQLVENATGMTATGIKASKLKEIPVAIPPVEEQHRIVQKVDELMVLCDRLEQQTSDQLEAHETLVDTLLGTLTQSENATELADNWARLAAHFDTLFTTEQSIDKLKQTILQLASAGKLVPFNVAPVSLKDILSFGPRNGFSPKESAYETGHRVLKLGATTKGWLDLVESKNVDIGDSAPSHLWLKKGDILIQRGNAANHVGCNVLLKEDCPSYLYPDLMMKIRVNEQEAVPSFVALYLSAPRSRQFMWERMTGTSGTMPKISKKVVEEIPVALPRLEIQRAVVQKVDQLMALCNQLKEHLNEASKTRYQLAEAVVEGALN